MRRKKSKVITYFLSFLPGVAFMYRGYMKRGISCLSIFLYAIYFCEWSHIGLLTMIPIIFWFYAFFEQINTFSLSDQEQLERKDEILFRSFLNKLDSHVILENHKFFGIFFVAIGIYGIMQGMNHTMLYYLPTWIQVRMVAMISFAPKLLISCGIIYLGVQTMEGRVPEIHLFKKETKASQLEKKETSYTESNVVYYMEQAPDQAVEDLEEKKS